jgi:hypothetical protein
MFSHAGCSIPNVANFELIIWYFLQINLSISHYAAINELILPALAGSRLCLSVILGLARQALTRQCAPVANLRNILWLAALSSYKDLICCLHKAFTNYILNVHKIGLYRTRFLIDRVRVLLLNEFLYWTSAQHDGSKETSSVTARIRGL